MTMTLVESITVGAGGAASIEFTSIPQDADDLLLVVSSRSAETGTTIASYSIQVNNTGQTASKRLYGTGSSVAATGSVSPFHPAVNAVSNTFGNHAIYFANYTSAVAKSASSDFVMEDNATASYMGIGASVFGSSAITSIKLLESFGFVEHSTASLYKVTKA